MFSTSHINRQTIELVSRSAPASIERILTQQDCVMVRTGCPIDDTIAIGTGDGVSLWHTGRPDELVNALGAKTNLVDPAVAWAPTLTAITADRSHLIVAIPDLEGHRSYTEPDVFDVVFVPVPGSLMPFETAPSRKSHWRQLRRYLASQSQFAVQRGQGLEIHPIEWHDYDHPTVSVFAQPGDDMEHGEGFYVFEEPSLDLEPIAPYRQSSINTVVDAACDVISTWGIPRSR